MGSSKLLVAFTLVVIVAISSDLFSGVNARTVPPTCYESCIGTFQDAECNKMCVGLAYKNGSCIYPPPVNGPPPKRPYYKRCCCNPIILSPPSL